MLKKLTPVMATAVLALAQMPPEPDFSGGWRLVSSMPSGAEAASAMTVVQPVKRADIYGKAMKPYFSELAVTREYADGPRAEIHRFGTIGGSVSGVVPGGRQAGPPIRTERRVVWEGRTLVMESSRYVGPASGWAAWNKRREEWSFDEEGRLRMAIITQTSERPEVSSMTLIYQRR